MAAAQESQENRQLTSANIFKGYLGVMAIVIATLAPVLTALNVIPVYDSQRKPLAAMAGILGFLLPGWVFYVRRTIALGSIKPGYRTFFNLCPLILVLASVCCYVSYTNTLDTSLSKISQANPGVTRVLALSSWSVSNAVPASLRLQLLYLGMFLFAEAAFVMMALREYSIDGREAIQQSAQSAVDLGQSTYRDLETLIADRQRYEEARFLKNVNDTFLLRSFELRNLRFFDNCSYEFAPRVNVLLGKNGYGKTLLLRALAATMQNDSENSAYLFPPSAKESLASPQNPEASMLILQVDRNGEPDGTVRDAIYFSADKSTGKIPLLAIPDLRFVNRNVKVLAISTIAATELSATGAQSFIAQEPFENTVMDLLVKLCLEFDRSGTLDRPIIRLITDVVRELTEDAKFAFHSINHVGSSGYEILVTTAGGEGNPLPIQSTSQGTLSVLVITGLIYSFLKSLRPNVNDRALLEVAAIVFIDEVDAHLHPSWQQKIMPILTKRFPNVQFIVSAHSPLLVAGCDRNEVAVLRHDAKTDRFYVDMLEQDFLGAKVEDLYKLVFEVGEMDHLYLEYSAKAAAGAQVQVAEQIERIENTPEWTAEQEAKISGLLRERRLLRRAGEVREARLQAVGTEARIEALQSEIERIKLELRKARGEEGKSWNIQN